MDLTDEKIRSLLSAIDGLDFTELTIEVAEARLVVRRGAPAGPAGVPAEAEPAGVPDAPWPDDGRQDVCAPMMGTFYQAPKPGAQPFVSVGDQVGPDTQVGIIEVMKLMNPVVAGVDGTVTAMLVGDGQLVEYDQPLLRLRTGDAR